MYRRRVDNLPGDPIYPHDLKKLGYKIDDNDCITSLKEPGEFFQFFITNNGRYNDVQREAMHDCARVQVSSRLASLGVPLLYLPTFTTEPPTNSKPHMPIHCTPLPLLKTKHRIVVIINRAREDLAILSYRVLSRAGGINNGSAVSIVQEIKTRAETAANDNGTVLEDEMPGIVILNTGQTLFSHKLGKAVTHTTWDALPRKSAVHPAPQINDDWNKIDGNKSFEEHIEYVFTHLLGSKEYVHQKAELYILGLCEGGDQIVKHLYENPDQYRIAGLALTGPLSIYADTTPEFLEKQASVLKLLAERARAWRLSSWPLNTPEANPDTSKDMKSLASSDETRDDEVVLYPLLSGGEPADEELIVTTGYKTILDWFDEVRQGGGVHGYKNPTLKISEEVKEGFKVEVADFGWQADPEPEAFSWVKDG